MMGLGVVLAIGSIVLGPEAPAGVVAALLAADAGVAVADAVMYFQDGDWKDGLLSLGFVLVPVAVGGVVRWVRLTRAQVDLLGTVDEITVDGVRVTRAEANAALEAAGSSVDGAAAGASSFSAKAQRGEIQWVKDQSSALIEMAAQREANIQAARVAQAAFDTTLADLNKALKEAGLSPVDSTAFSAKQVESTMATLTDELDDTPELLQKALDMREASRVRTEALNAQNTLSEAMGEQAGTDLAAMARDTPVVTDPSPGSGTVDQAWLSHDGHQLIINECKGPSAGLGTRQVTLPDATVVTAEQGSTAYLYDILRSDTRLRSAIMNDSTLRDGLVDGSITIRYQQVRPDAAGNISVREFGIDPSQLDISGWLS